MIETLTSLVFVGILLLFRPKKSPITLIVPHIVTEVSVDEGVGLVHVANHALARRYRPGQAMSDRMPGLVFTNLWITCCAATKMAKNRVGAGMQRLSVIGINYMARCAAA